MRVAHIMAWVVVYASLPLGVTYACVVRAPIDPYDATFADAVVIGEIIDYRIIENQRARARRQEMLESAPPEVREILSDDAGYLSDYARFNIEVSTVLRGDVSGVVGVTWDNSTFGEPHSMPSGQYLIALRHSASPMPPLRGPSATVLPDPEPDLWKVLQAPCAPPFIFASTSEEAVTIRQILASIPQ